MYSDILTNLCVVLTSTQDLFPSSSWCLCTCSCPLDVGKMTARMQMSWKMAPRNNPYRSTLSRKVGSGTSGGDRSSSADMMLLIGSVTSLCKWVHLAEGQQYASDYKKLCMEGSLRKFHGIWDKMENISAKCISLCQWSYSPTYTDTITLIQKLNAKHV